VIELTTLEVYLAIVINAVCMGLGVAFGNELYAWLKNKHKTAQKRIKRLVK